MLKHAKVLMQSYPLSLGCYTDVFHETMISGMGKMEFINNNTSTYETMVTNHIFSDIEGYIIVISCASTVHCKIHLFAN